MNAVGGLAHVCRCVRTGEAFSGGSPRCIQHSELGLLSFLLTDQGRGWLDAPDQPPTLIPALVLPAPGGGAGFPGGWSLKG